jgi:hypothetical protein
MAKVQFINWNDHDITYKHEGQWYKVPFYVLEDYSNDFFLEEYELRLPLEQTKAARLTRLLSGELNNPVWNRIDPKNYSLVDVMKAGEISNTVLIAEFKDLFADQLSTEFKAYQLYNYE